MIIQTSIYVEFVCFKELVSKLNNFVTLTESMVNQLQNELNLDSILSLGALAVQVGHNWLFQIYDQIDQKTVLKTFQIDKNQVVLRSDLQGNLCQFCYGNYFLLSQNESYFLLDNNFEVVEFFNFMTTLNHKAQHQIARQGDLFGIYDTNLNYFLTTDKILLNSITVQKGYRKDQQLFLGKSKSVWNSYSILNQFGVAVVEFDSNDNLDHMSLILCTNVGTLLVKCGNLYFVIKLDEKIKSYKLETDLVIHPNREDSQNFYAYHPKVLDIYGSYDKSLISMNVFDNLYQNIGVNDYSIFQGVSTPDMYII